MTPGDIHVGDISGIEGEVNIAGGDIYKGYTAEQVSVLLTQITTTLQPKPFDGRCPYKGLEVFEEEDADLFFGRERLVADLLSRVKESRTVFITGPSGSGKSSLVRAGLLHALKKGAVEGSERWLYETMKPGREPLKDLALAFSRLKSPELANYFQAHAAEASVLHDCAESVLSAREDQRFVLFVDQFEEVFTQVSQQEERLRFLEMLSYAGTLPEGRVMVLFAMRSDFVSNCATYPALNELLSQQFRQIGAMQPEELVSAIALPAKHVGLPIEDELIARIINDMKGEPGALPLMQFALKDLFDAQMAKGGVVALTLEDYLRHGGIHKSLERHADSSFARLNPHEQQLARSIFTGLIEIGRGTSDTRRIALFDELVPVDASSQEVETIVGKLADARLIITDEQAGKDTVTISHEKLIDAWPWLKKLVNENRDVIALQNEIANDAKEWQEHGRDPSYLYNGARLINAREQLHRNNLVLSGPAHEFVRAGADRQRRGQILLYGSLSAVITLLVVAVLVFSRQSQQNKALARQAEVRALAAESVAWRERNLPVALLLGVEVFKKEDNPQTRGVLLDNVQFNPQLVRFLRGHSDAVTSVAVNADGVTLASGSADGTIRLWDLRTYEPIGEPLAGHENEVLSVAFSPDGKTLASGSADGTIILWDVNMQQMIGQPLRGHSGAVYSVAFHPTRELLASGSADHSIILWNVETHEPAGSPLTGHNGAVHSLAFRADGQLLASGGADNMIFLWDVESQTPNGSPLGAHLGAVLSVAFSPDGKTLASGSADNNVILWDLSTRQPIEQPLRRHSHRVASVVFSPDGKILATAGYDENVILWDVATHRRIGPLLRGHLAEVFGVAFSPDGQTLISGSADRTAIVWELSTDKRIDQLILGQGGFINRVAFHPDGHMLASGSRNGEVTLWDVQTREMLGAPLRGHTAVVRSVAFHPDGHILASGSDDGTVIFWDTKTYTPVGQPLDVGSGAVHSLAFSGDGGVLAIGGADGTITVWDLNAQVASTQMKGHAGTVNDLAFSPDRQTLASGGDDGTIRLWEWKTGQPVGEPLTGHANRVLAVAFSPDGKTLASGSADQTILLWDIRVSPPSRHLLSQSSSAVSSLDFNPDGRMLAAGLHDTTILLFDVTMRQAIGQPLQGHTGAIYTVAFSPDGMTLVSGSFDNNIVLWDMDPQTWLAKSCQRVGRNFTRLEWSQYFPNENYHRTCEEWPAAPQTEANPASAGS
jgi:WD40 repeat protein